MKTQVTIFKGMGRGVVVAAGDYFIPSNSKIMVCEILVLSTKDTVVVNTTDLQHYTFKYNKTQDCLVLGDGEIFNHSDTPNVSYRLKNKYGRKVMVFTALRDLFPGEQLFIDYNADVKVNVLSYTDAKSLVG